MKKNKICFLATFSLFSLLAIFAFSKAETTDILNAGFVKGFWYSKTPFFEGETVRIYIAFQNRSGFDLTGKVRFFINDKVLAEPDFSALDGRLIELWVDWQAVKGKHAIFAEIIEPKKSLPGKVPEPVKLNSSFSSEDIVFIEAEPKNETILPDENKNKEQAVSENKDIAEVSQTEESRQNKDSGILAKTYDSIKKVGSAAAEAVAGAVSPITEKIDDFSGQQGEKIKEKADNLKAEIETEKINNPENKNIGKQIGYYGLAFASFFLSQKLLKYFLFFLLLFLIYRIVKKIFS